jgi:hypothetical protein
VPFSVVLVTEPPDVTFAIVVVVVRYDARLAAHLAWLSMKLPTAYGVASCHTSEVLFSVCALVAEQGCKPLGIAGALSVALLVVGELGFAVGADVRTSALSALAKQAIAHHRVAVEVRAR